MRRRNSLFGLLLLAACGGNQESGELAQTSYDQGPAHTEPFFAIAKSALSDAVVGRSTHALTATAAGEVIGATTDKEFYLAIHKSQLGQRFFLSSYVRQSYPDGGLPGAYSLGTQVVSFAVQNNELLMFDVDDRKKASDTFDPQVILDAFPIVKSTTLLKGVPGATNYILFDPAEGRNEFSVLGSPSDSLGVALKLEVAFLQRFRKIADGITFEKVFSGSLAHSDGSLETWSGTLGMGLRRYTEGAGYQTLPMPEGNRYFPSLPKKKANTGTTELPVARWNLQPGMTPIRWLISREVLAAQQDPRWAGYDLLGAITRGIEGWNQVFGYTVLEAQLAGDDDSQGDDDKNVLVFDRDPSTPYAFANWRTNPNSGEIRGASVYFSSVWLDAALSSFGDASAKARVRQGALDGLAEQAAPQLNRLRWGGAEPATLCAYYTGDFLKAALAVASSTTTPSATASSTTSKARIEAFITHVVLHEIGHTLGLRHNFKGSIGGISEAQPASSVMDYLQDVDSAALTTPGPYDTDALRYLYGINSSPAAQPFCTDEQLWSDPDCTSFDRGNAPLTLYFGTIFQRLAGDYLNDGPLAQYWDAAADYYLVWVDRYIWLSPTDPKALTAFNLSVQGSAVPLSTSASTVYRQKADRVLRTVLMDLFTPPFGLSDSDPNIAFKTGNPELDQALLTQLKGVLLNSDAARSFESRRTVVDMLWRLQTEPALLALLEARRAIVAQRDAAGLPDSALLDDLVRRIDLATNPYFVR